VFWAPLHTGTTNNTRAENKKCQCDRLLLVLVLHQKSSIYDHVLIRTFVLFFVFRDVLRVALLLLWITSSLCCFFFHVLMIYDFGFSLDFLPSVLHQKYYRAAAL